MLGDLGLAVLRVSDLLLAMRLPAALLSELTFALTEPAARCRSGVRVVGQLPRLLTVKTASTAMTRKLQLNTTALERLRIELV